MASLYHLRPRKWTAHNDEHSDSDSNNIGASCQIHSKSAASASAIETAASRQVPYLNELGSSSYLYPTSLEYNSNKEASDACVGSSIYRDYFIASEDEQLLLPQQREMVEPFDVCVFFAYAQSEHQLNISCCPAADVFMLTYVAHMGGQMPLYAIMMEEQDEDVSRKSRFEWGELMTRVVERAI
ncbi:hypothetical protein FOA52_003279 [Chlamydomonas sp. UWO 241]|nr:hypothetical protein FOA52_003279 [Chlamydomonas sp. UWO 241]